jgi:hypothetical protein
VSSFGSRFVTWENFSKIQMLFLKEKGEARNFFITQNKRKKTVKKAFLWVLSVVRQGEEKGGKHKK